MTIYKIKHPGETIDRYYGYVNTAAEPLALRRAWLDFEESPASALYMVKNTATFVKWLNNHGIAAELVDADHIKDVYL